MTDIQSFERDRPDIIDKIKVLDLKKGDVLVVKYHDRLPELIGQPRQIVETHHNHLKHNLEMISEFVKKNWGGAVGMITVPDSIDFEVIRLEEWFV